MVLSPKQVGEAEWGANSPASDSVPCGSLSVKENRVGEGEEP